MVHHCNNCPGKEARSVFLRTVLNDDEVITYQQRETIDRCTMRARVHQLPLTFLFQAYLFLLVRLA